MNNTVPLQQPVDNDSLSGTVRLSIAVPVAVASFFYTNILEYALPLYFDALELPKDTWSNLVKYKVVAWILGSALAGLLSRRYGERFVWSCSLLGKVVVILGLIYCPTPGAIVLLAAWQGLTGALMWIAGVSLVQMVPEQRKGLSNGLIMVSVGVGAVFGALIGRFIIYIDELKPFVYQTNLPEFFSRLFNFVKLTSTPQIEDFYSIFWLLMATTILSSVAIALFGQRPGKFQREEPANWKQTFKDVGLLVSNPTFWALVIPLALLGGPVFQASNQFLPYRAEELGLKQGSEDQGWIWLQLLKTFMWIPGGIAVAFLAGKRAPGWVAAMMLGCFAVTAFGIGMSILPWHIFLWVACFEFTRQFMRWSQAGYLAEHMPGNLRPTAIGCAIMLSGLGSSLYCWIVPILWDPNSAEFVSWKPIVTAAILGLTGTLGLLIYHYFRPINANSVKSEA